MVNKVLKAEDVNWWIFDPICKPLVDYHHKVLGAYKNFLTPNQTYSQLAGKVVLLATAPLGYIIGGLITAIGKLFESIIMADFSKKNKEKAIYHAIEQSNSGVLNAILQLKKIPNNELATLLTFAGIRGIVGCVVDIISQLDLSQPCDSDTKTEIQVLYNTLKKKGMIISTSLIMSTLGEWASINPEEEDEVSEEDLKNIEKPDESHQQMTPNELILPFYQGVGKDSEGRTLQEILNYNYSKKESQHNYIQWLFPSRQASAFNKNSPVMTPELYAAMRNDPVIMQNLTKAFHSMLDFYGLKYVVEEEDKPKVIPADNYPERSKNWLTPGNHNMLRITRILDCLKHCGLKAEAVALYRALEEINKTHPQAIGVAIDYWRDTVAHLT